MHSEVEGVDEWDCKNVHRVVNKVLTGGIAT